MGEGKGWLRGSVKQKDPPEGGQEDTGPGGGGRRWGVGCLRSQDWGEDALPGSQAAGTALQGLRVNLISGGVEQVSAPEGHGMTELNPGH